MQLSGIIANYIGNLVSNLTNPTIHNYRKELKTFFLIDDNVISVSWTLNSLNPQQKCNTYSSSNMLKIYVLFCFMKKLKRLNLMKIFQMKRKNSWVV